MATYIPNVTDTFPDIQPFRPDYQFLQSALQYKQSKFDAAFNQINSVYGSILNAPLTRSVNQERRDEFLKAADAELKKVTSMDLSLPQNVQMASNIFKPFYEDKHMVKDISWTRNWNNEIQKAQSLKNCTDDSCVDKYWEGGVQLLQYDKERFANSSAEESLAQGMSSYVPAYNVVKEAVKLAKDQGFNVKYDTIKNGYIVTTKNGQALEAPLSVYFSEVFANNSQANAYMNAQARLKRETDIRQMAPQYNNDIKLAESAYIKSNLQDVEKIKQAQLEEIEDSLINSNAAKASYELIMQRRKLLPSEQKKYDQILETNKMLTSASEKAYDSLSMIKSAYNNDDLSYGRNIVDNMLSSSYMSASLQKAVKAAAYRDTETSIKADPYALARYKDQLAEAREIRKEKREAEAEAVKLGFFDNILKKERTDKNYKIEDLFKDQSAAVTASRSELNQDVSSLVNSLRSNNDTIKSAIDGLLRKHQITEDDLTGKTVGDASKYRKLFADINETILKTNPDLAIALSPLIKEAVKDAEKYDFQYKTFKENNLLVSRALKNNPYKDAPEIVDLLIDPKTGDFKADALKSIASNAAKRAINEVQYGSIAGSIMNTLFYNGPSSQIENLYKDIAESYDKQRDNLQSLGLGVTKGAGGRGVAKTAVAVVDPFRYQSPTLAATKGLLNELDNWSASQISSDSGVKNLRSILENLRIDLNTFYDKPTQDRPIVSVEYIPLADGTVSKHEAILKINSDYLNRLKTQGIIDKNKDINDVEKLAETGIRIILDADKTQNDFKKSLDVDYRDIILQKDKKYTIENPGGKITFTLQPDGTKSMNGEIMRFENGDLKGKSYDQYYVTAGGSQLYDQTYELLMQQALVNQALINANQ